MAYPDYMDYKTAIARGLTDHTTTVMNAYCTTISNTAMLLRPINSFGMTTPSAAQYLRLTSSDANDATAGSGARTVYIDGILGSGTSGSETLTLDGQTPATTANQYLRVNRMYVNSIGSGAINAGNIYLSENAGSTAAGVPKATTSVFSIIAIGDGTSKDAKYYVPAGKTAYLMGLTFGGNPTTWQRMNLWEKQNGAAKQQAMVNYYANGHNQVVIDVPQKFSEKTDIWFEVYGSADSATAADITGQLVIIDEVE